MAISIQITAEQLREPGVAIALGSLFQALGGVVEPSATVAIFTQTPTQNTSTPQVTQTAPVVQIAPTVQTTPAVQTPPIRRVPARVQPIQAAPKKKRGRPRKNPIVEVAATKETATTTIATLPPVVEEKTNSNDAKNNEVNNLERLLEQVSDKSRQFMVLLKEHKQLSMKQAMKLLGLNEQKAVGGVVGGISRKAGKFHLYPPFSKGKTESGERFWIWTGEVRKAPASPSPAPTKKKKRGPGRPRKNPASVKKGPKRKPGRPKKEA